MRWMVCRVASMFAKDFCNSAAMSSNSERFAKLVLAAFDAEGHTTDELVHEAGGPSSTYMTGLRKAATGAPMTEPRSDTYRRIESAAGWRRGVGRRVWLGEDPELLRHAAAVRLREAVGPDAVIVERQPGPRKKRYSAGRDGFIERLADRLLDLEERVDFLEQQMQKIGGDEGDAGGTPATRKPDSGPDEPPSSGLSVLPTAASKTPTTPSVNKRRQRQDDAAQASQDDGDFEPR